VTVPQQHVLNLPPILLSESNGRCDELKYGLNPVASPILLSPRITGLPVRLLRTARCFAIRCMASQIFEGQTSDPLPRSVQCLVSPRRLQHALKGQLSVCISETAGSQRCRDLG
jgi:hypothetical protein